MQAVREVFTVRTAVAADADQLLDLWWHLTTAGTAADPRYAPRPDARATARRFIAERWLAADDPQQAIVAEASSRLVGLIVTKPADPHPILDLPPTLVVTDAVVVDGARRQGIGRALVAAARDVARRHGYTTIEVGTLSSDRRAVDFWQAMGFADWRVTLRSPSG